MASTRIEPAAPHRADPFEQARRIFVKLLLLGAVIMAIIGYTDYRQGLSNTLDLVMLPTLICITLVSSWVVSRSHHRMRQMLILNALVLTFYYEGIFFQSVISDDMVSAYSLASTAQFLPGLYICLFVFFTRRAAQISWALYATLAAQCLLGLLVFDGPQANGTKEQLYIAILTSHPCCIIVLTFMNHLRRMIEEARKESMDAKERFLAMVSHEVRTPLQTIVSSLELIEANPSPTLMARSIRRVKGAAGMLEAQIRDLTTFTKLELTNELRPEPVDLDELSAQIEQALQGDAQQKGLSLKREVGNKLPPLVMADSARLRQIIDNLVSNALKYTSAGTVTIGVAHAPDGRIHWWVEDTGRGIPADRLQEVFEPFVRIKASPQERIEGSGLGLAVVRQLVGLMHGDIELRSELAHGTRFDIHLPLPIIEPPSPGGGELGTPPDSALVVDDDPDILHTLCDLLRHWGVSHIETASDGDQADIALQGGRFDLALIDLQLPGRSGYAVAQAAHEHSPNAGAVLIAISAVGLDRQQAGAPRFDAYLPKPVSRHALLQAIQKARLAKLGTLG